MNDPYEVLGISRLADETQTRRKYLERIRQFSPYRDPARFAAIRAAYEQVRHPDQRLYDQIFQIDSGHTLEDVAAQLRTRIRERSRRAPLNLILGLAEAP